MVGPVIRALVGAVAVVALLSTPLTFVLLVSFLLDQLDRSPSPCGWPDCQAPECQAGADEEQDEGERVGPDLGAEEPQQGDEGSGDVADECDHGHFLPHLRRI